jgi:cyclohexanecarboxylate-CoA ligase
MTTDLWHLLEERATSTPDAEALVERNGRRRTFAELVAGSARTAAWLAAVGIGDGDTVAWELPTSIEAVELTLALARLSVIQVPIIAIYREREVGHCCRETGARWLITGGSFRGFDFDDMGARVASDLGLTHLNLTPGAPPRSDYPQLPTQAEASDDPRWIFYTSGTTSLPKGVLHTNQALAWVGTQLVEMLHIEEGDRYSLVFPLPHIGGIILLFSCIQSGFTHLIDDTFDPVTTPSFLAVEGVTHAGTGTPFHLAYLVAQRADPDHVLFPRLKCCPGGAAPKPPTLHEQVKRELGGVGIISSWGMTEAPVLTASRFDDADAQLATTEGRPLPGVELRVVAADGTLAPTGEEGELQVKGPQVAVGYVDDRHRADAFSDGWLRTGDLGTIDAGGYVRITGRLKDMVIRNGENISAKEVEDLLFTHPGVADVAVIGLPDPRTGERVCAVVSSRGARPPELDDLARFLREQGLRTQALPERLELVESIPRNPAGKVMKQDLRDRYGTQP